MPPRRVLVVSGPNLQLLGTREPHIYGTDTLSSIHARLADIATEREAHVDCRQSNHEGEIVAWVGEASRSDFHGVLLNPGAYGHTSIALYDAIKASGVPVVEIHLSNPEAREAFRRRSRISAACFAKVAGFGATSYELGLTGLLAKLGSG